MPETTKIIAVYTEKGGTSKTTISWLLGEGLTYCGSDGDEIKVLCIDNDSQGNLTKTLISTDIINSSSENLLNVYQGGSILENILTTRYNNLHIVPSSKSLSQNVVKVDSLQKALEPLITGENKGYYKYIIIDNHPSNDNLTNASLVAADIIIIPFTADFYGYSGLNETYKFLKQNYPGKEVIIVPSMLRPTATAYAFMNAARKFYDKGIITATEIPFAQEVETSKMKGNSIFMKTTSKVAMGFINLMKEMFHYDVSKITMNIFTEKKTKKRELAIRNFKRAERVSVEKQETVSA